SGEVSLSYGYNPQSVLLVVPHQSNWAAVHCLLTPSLSITPVRTLGLRGLAHSISFNNLLVDIAPISADTMYMLYSFLFLGIVAIAIGIAQSAYTRAYAYAHERYQRGGLIKTIESVQSLLGKSKATITTIRHALYQATLGDSYRLLNFAAQLKFMASTKLHVAVSDCLQVFGGYGYMEDFGIEKKYRDINTLGTIAGSPIFMEQFIAQLSMEE
ncbi:MAG: acyl-CoA dehydrogenase family protein, partial [Spirochaetota bacterium]